MVKRYFLTGAGFTHNFGAPLANQMWALILSYVDGTQTPELRQQLLDNFDFEDVYQQVMERDGDGAQRDALGAAVEQAYRVVDEIVTDFKFVNGSRYPVNIYKVQKLIGAFANNGGEPGYYFTLNQDLFVERQHYNDPRPSIPGIQPRSEWFTTNFRQPLSPPLFCKLPSAAELERYKREPMRDRFCYIKLHGSCNWRDAAGSNRMVLGRGKSQYIEREPLLAWYLDIFKTALGAGDARLLVAGYGFGDPHINAIIADAVSSANLRVFVLSPEQPSVFSEKLLRLERGREIWSGLGGYFQTTLAELFPANQDETPEWLVIQDRFFNRRIR